MQDGFMMVPHAWSEAVAQINLNGNTHRVLWVILRHTFGWQRDTVKISQYEIAKMTGVHRRTVRRCLEDLVCCNVIAYTPGTGRDPAEIKLRQDYQHFKREIGHACAPASRGWKVEDPKVVRLSEVNRAHGPAHKEMGHTSAPCGGTELRPLMGHTSAPTNKSAPIIGKKRKKDLKKEKILPSFDSDLWGQFVAFRSEIRKPITKATEAAVIEQILWVCDGYPQRWPQVIKTCMAQGWAMLNQKLDPPTLEEKYSPEEIAAFKEKYDIT